MDQNLLNVNKLDLLNVNELAETLRVPKSWVYSRTRETGPEAIPRIRVGKYIRFDLNSVLKYLKDQQEGV